MTLEVPLDYCLLSMIYGTLTAHTFLFIPFLPGQTLLNIMKRKEEERRGRKRASDKIRGWFMNERKDCQLVVQWDRKNNIRNKQ